MRARSLTINTVNHASARVQMNARARAQAALYVVHPYPYTTSRISYGGDLAHRHHTTHTHTDTHVRYIRSKMEICVGLGHSGALYKISIRAHMCTCILYIRRVFAYVTPQVFDFDMINIRSDICSLDIWHNVPPLPLPTAPGKIN